MDRLSSGVALAAYAAPFLEGRRVVVFGDATSHVARELLERGARGVHVYDPEPSRAALAAGKNRSKQLSIVPLDDADLAVRDGAFDVAIVEDLSLAKEPVTLLKRVRRALAARGTALIASPNVEAKVCLVPRTSAGSGEGPLGYYDLYDAVAAEFSEVRMLGQTPFVGYAIVDFAPDGEPEVSIDTDLVPEGAEEPEWFVAVASREAVECDPFGIVQLPTASVLGEHRDPSLATELRAVRASEASLVARVAALETELSRVPEPPKAPEQGVVLAAIQDPEQAEQKAALEASVAALTAEKQRLEGQLGPLTTERDRTKGSLAAAQAERGTLKASLAKALADKTALETQIADRDTLKASLAKALADKTALESQIADRDALKASLAKALADKAALEAQIADRDAQIKKLASSDELAPADEISALEGGLKERARRILELESNLRDAQRVGKELVRELAKPAERGLRAYETAETAETAEAPEEAAEPAAARNARLVADLEAAGWTIQELEGRLAQATPAPDPR